MPASVRLATTRPAPLQRRPAVLGGTTTLRDCLAALRLLVSGRLVDGPALARYEQAFAAVIGCRHASSFASGRVGLHGLLRALDVSAGDEVLVPVPTHIVVANAVRYTGATPVYVDCHPDTCGMDLVDAEAKVSPRTKALILQHTFGFPADVERALALGRRAGVAIVEDCVHALGATHDGRPLGSFGIAGVFSTEETKTISTTMGGMVVTNDDGIAGRLAGYQEQCAAPPTQLAARYLLKFLMLHLLTEPHIHRHVRDQYIRMGRRSPAPRATADEEMRGDKPPHYDQRLSSAQAELGLRQLGRLDANLAHRRHIAGVYSAALQSVGVPPANPPTNGEPALLRFPVWVEDRPRVLAQLGSALPLGTWFTSVLEEASSPVSGGYEEGTCPMAEAAATQLVNLPTHPRVSVKDAERFVRELHRLGALSRPPACGHRPPAGHGADG